MKSAMRPKGVLLTYKGLIREAARDESTLVSLENLLRTTELEEAKLQDPWELITKPTLLQDPNTLSYKALTLIGFLVGLSSGILLAFFREKRSNIIYEPEMIEQLLKPKFSEIVTQNDIDTKSNKLLFIKEFINKILIVKPL